MTAAVFSEGQPDGAYVYLEDADVRILCGDVLEVLRGMSDESVHMACTSPPFYGLRDYGTQGQIGLEATPDEWVARLVEVFRELRRVLRKDGTFWLEVGESFESKQLRGTPWRLAFALQDDGWFLRSEIIWAKPNPMPESVTDRPTVSHSRVFLFAKSARYFYDAEAIREPHMEPWRSTGRIESNGHGAPDDVKQTFRSGERPREYNQAGRNRRSVWTIPTEPYPEAHFATWPQKLVERMILAGTSEKGVCPECGAPWMRVTEDDHDAEGRTTNGQKPRTDERRGFDVRMVKATSTLGWQPTCECFQGPSGVPKHFPHDPEPATVLDPFGGSGTTAYVARRLGRRAVLIELNPEYCSLAAKRLEQQSLFAEVRNA